MLLTSRPYWTRSIGVTLASSCGAQDDGYITLPVQVSMEFLLRVFPLHSRDRTNKMEWMPFCRESLSHHAILASLEGDVHHRGVGWREFFLFFKKGEGRKPPIHHRGARALSAHQPPVIPVSISKLKPFHGSQASRIKV